MIINTHEPSELTATNVLIITRKLCFAELRTLITEHQGIDCKDMDICRFEV